MYGAGDVDEIGSEDEPVRHGEAAVEGRSDVAYLTIAVADVAAAGEGFEGTELGGVSTSILLQSIMAGNGWWREEEREGTYESNFRTMIVRKYKSVIINPLNPIRRLNHLMGIRAYETHTITAHRRLELLDRRVRTDL